MAEGPYRVLLVEDEPVIRELVRTMLSTGAVEVVCAQNGLEAIKLCREKPVNLVLLDIVLPAGLDGIAVLRMLRADPATAAVPIYMLTAKQKSADIETAQRAGSTGYIQKPFRAAELMDLVERHRAAAAAT
jgi:CheY-like chemotaxis protein